MVKQYDTPDPPIDHASDPLIDQKEPNYADMEEYEFDDDAFFEEYTKHSRKTNERSNNARRKIEQLREERELRKRLSDF